MIYDTYLPTNWTFQIFLPKNEEANHRIQSVLHIENCDTQEQAINKANELISESLGVTLGFMLQGHHMPPAIEEKNYPSLWKNKRNKDVRDKLFP